MRLRITSLPGDGIGPEVTRQAVRVLEAVATGFAHKCSACASCCLNAVVSTEAPSFETAKLSNHFAPLITRTLAAYVTEGLERPPRSFLA